MTFVLLFAESGKMMWLVDFVGYSLRTAPPLSTTRMTVHILQNHYPERLGAALCYYPPLLFSCTWRVSALLSYTHRTGRHCTALHLWVTCAPARPNLESNEKFQHHFLLMLIPNMFNKYITRM